MSCSWGLLAQDKGYATILMDSTTFLIGDQISMELIVNVPAGYTPTFPIIDEILEKEKLEIVDQQERKLIKGKPNYTYKQKFILTAWEPDTYQIPALSFAYKNDGALVEFESASLMLHVIAPQVTGDSTYVADIKTILAESPNLLDQLYGFFTHPVAVALLILLLAFLAFYAFMQYKNRLKTIVPKTPEEVLLEQLEALKQSDLLGQHRYKEYHTSISFLLRTYLNGRFQIKALERPTAAFLPLLKEHDLLAPSLYEEFEMVLEHADLIKYAKASPLDLANKKALSFCFELVESVQEKLSSTRLETEGEEAQQTVEK
ncbi:MAG: Unknown protein [uncultured Aureispira sp.]|uniref:Uncharacterized protein n=1 Tax=uncultured Aureispira sp. TaxID=1331704 RepID=A0A6S6SH57_9BACT|nr:MAG: Unknown protein [uncultured Aureispira sp.]